MFVPLDALRGAGKPQADGGGGSAGHPGSGWDRALALVLAAFSQARGPWSGSRMERPVGDADEGDGDDEEGGETDDKRVDRLSREVAARRKAAVALEALLDVMLAPAHAGRHARTAFWMSHYLADRNRPRAAVVQTWLRRVLQALREIDPGKDAGIIAAALMLFAFEDGKRAPAKARRYLMERGVDPTSLAADPSSIPGYAAALPGTDPVAAAAAASAVRTAGEQVRSFIAACDGTGGRDGFSLLREAGEWPLLAAALDDATRRARLHIYDSPPVACPGCHMKLPPAKLERLRVYGVTSCCRPLLCTESAP